jgi:methylase of polypeptide subunit release factors
VDKKELGDWQTPLPLARDVLAVVVRHAPEPRVVLEPTCGEGAFLIAASERYPRARLVGYELNEDYLKAAQTTLPRGRAQLGVADFFGVDWESEIARLVEPILIVGNPPWVTNSVLGVLRSTNLPEKSNFKGLKGLDALTGKSNFDVSEWMLLRLIVALARRRATLAVLCKAAVARRVVEESSALGLPLEPGGFWRIDAKRHFRAAVDAVLFVCSTGAKSAKKARWPMYDALEARTPEINGVLVEGKRLVDADRHTTTAHLVGSSDPEWRSGMKHDCARVMELDRRSGGFVNGFGESVVIEDELVFPLLKSSDVARGKSQPSRAVVVPQRALGDDTSKLASSAPRAFRYLAGHRELFLARKSSIYRKQPDFAVFGIGPYAFAPYKVAISGLYKRCQFTLIGPHEGRPVMLDDTCYFLPFDDEAAARRVQRALMTSLARDFFQARVFWDAKRPITKSVLQTLNLQTLLRESAKSPP